MEPESYADTAATPVTDEIVTVLYRGMLGREPDRDGLAHWSALIEGGADMTTLYHAILASDEYRSRQQRLKDVAGIKRKTAAWAQANLHRPLRIVDVGAQKLEDEDDIYSGIAAYAIPHTLIGFEPLQHRIDEARSSAGMAGHTFLPYFIGDGGSHTFHINQPDATSSLLPFNQPLTDQLIDLSCLRTDRTEDVVTTTLDAALDDGTPVDFLKLDIQGCELKALQAAPQVLQRTSMIHCEVSFAEIYQGQPLFSELELFMRQSGFIFIDFSHLCRYAYHGKYSVYRDRLGWGDALFLKDTDNMPPHNLLVQALCMLFVYNKLSLAQSLAQRYDLLTGSSFATLLLTDQP